MSLYKETLMKHFRNPEYKVVNDNASVIKDGVNPSCGDSLTLFMNMDKESIKNITFTGNGCAISMASADILCKIIKDVDQPLKIIEDFKKMITGEDINFEGELKVLNVFQEMQSYPARRSCALLPWNTLEEAIKG